MNWLRWYNETSKDGKFALIARKTKLPIPFVLGVWASFLEYASQHEDRGSLRGFDFEMQDATFFIDDGTTEQVYRAMEAIGMITDDRIAAWDKRQYQIKRDDNSTERVRQHRERKKKAMLHSDDKAFQTQENCDETQEMQPETHDETQCNAACNAGVTHETRPDIQIYRETDLTEYTDLQSGKKRTNTSRPRPEPVTAAGAASASPPDCPHEAIIGLYHEILPMLPKVQLWTDARRSLLRTRWREDKARQNLDWWRHYFELVADSDFLCGRCPPGKTGRPFMADLEWLIRPTNMPKVLEGKYANGDAADSLEEAKRLGYDEIRRRAFGDFGSLRGEYVDIDEAVRGT